MIYELYCIIKRINVDHLRIRPFECGQCQKAFIEKNSLDRHIKLVHLKIKPHECSKCKKTFSIKLALFRGDVSCLPTPSILIDDIEVIGITLPL